MADRKMQTYEGANANPRLNAIIGEYLAQIESGCAPNPEQLIATNRDLADELRSYFVQNGQLQSIDAAVIETDAAAIDTNASNLREAESPTLPPGNDTDPYVSVDTQAPTQKPADGSKNTVGRPKASLAGSNTFGGYDLLDEIARGGMGVVFKARQRALNRIVALKMILSGEFAGEPEIRRFHIEAEAAAHLDHPGIVPIFEIGEHEGQHFFSMAYVEGTSLAQKIANGPLRSQVAAELVQKVCDAIAYAHEQGVIHRDLKPANILIDSQDQPKVTDFGLAKKTETDSNLTGTGQILGTPAYMPPEQAAGKIDEVGPLADVYSLGAILYCALTGRPPFQSATPIDTLTQVLDGEPVPLRQLDPQIDRDLETICLKCLEKLPSKRYASAQCLSEDLGRFLRDEPIRARPPNFRERAIHWARNHVVLVTTIMLLLATTTMMLPFAGLAALDFSAISDRQHQLVIDEMQRIIESDPDDAAARFELGQAYLEQHRIDEAIEVISAAIRLDDGKWRYHLKLGMARIRKEQFQEAIEDLTRSIELDPTGAEGYYERARARYEIGDVAGSHEDVSQAIALRPGFADAYLLRSKVSLRLGEKTDSCRDREAAKRLSSE